MPAQQRFGPDEQPVPARAGQQPGQASQQGSVGPVHPRAGHLAEQNGHLVAQHEQLGVLGGRARCQERKPPHHLAEHQVEQSYGPAAIIARPGGFSTNSQLSATTDFLAPTGSGEASIVVKPK